MRAMRAEQFSGYEALKLVELRKPTVTDGKVLVRITAAGVTPLDHTILSGNFHTTKVPLILGNEGAGVVEEGGGTDFPAGSRVMFWGTYGAFEDGTYSEWIAVRREDLCLIPDNIDDVSAAGIPVAYLTAQVALTRAGFGAGKTVLAPAIGGSIGNAVTQLARATGAGVVGEPPPILGYPKSRKTTIDVTDLIVPQASIRSLNMFAQPKAAVSDAWNVIVPLLKSGAVGPIVAKTFPLAKAADALRYLVEGRP